jgi:HAE1 family hydrophobic/amphiphilic exporter-1
MTRKLRKDRPLPITGKALGETLSIGLLMVLGIAAKGFIFAKDFIVLVEYALAAEKERKMSRFEALLDATRKRARPIAITFQLP